MQSEADGKKYRFILNYQEYFAKYWVFRLLKTRMAKESTNQVINIIPCLLGALFIDSQIMVVNLRTASSLISNLNA